MPRATRMAWRRYRPDDAEIDPLLATIRSSPKLSWRTIVMNARVAHRGSSRRPLCQWVGHREGEDPVPAAGATIGAVDLPGPKRLLLGRSASPVWTTTKAGHSRETSCRIAGSHGPAPHDAGRPQWPRHALRPAGVRGPARRPARRPCRRVARHRSAPCGHRGAVRDCWSPYLAPASMMTVPPHLVLPATGSDHPFCAAGALAHSPAAGWQP
jgi:hypothetical protein